MCLAFAKQSARCWGYKYDSHIFRKYRNYFRRTIIYIYIYKFEVTVKFPTAKSQVPCEYLIRKRKEYIWERSITYKGGRDHDRHKDRRAG